MKRIIMILIALLLIFCFITPTLAATSTNASDWAQEGVLRSYQKGILPEPFLHKAKDDITREEFCVIMMNFYESLTGKVAEPTGDGPFVDTKSKEIIFAYEKGIVNGISKNHFNPNGKLTREQMAVILVRTLQACGIDLKEYKKNSNFIDTAQTNSIVSEAINILYEAKIVSGYNNKFYPKKNVTVQEGVIAVLNAYDLFANEKKLVSETRQTDEMVVINGKEIFFGDDSSTLKKIWGEPDRIHKNAYGQERYVYLNDYKNLFIVSFENDHIVEIYTNSKNFEYKGIQGNQNRFQVINIKYLDRRLNRIELRNNDLDAFILLDDKDNINGLLLRSLKYKKEYDKKFGTDFKQDMPIELLDLINSARVQNKRSPLVWNQEVAKIAENHCFDMKKNNYLGYNDKDGKTPFERMSEGDINYTMAAETIAKIEGDSIDVYHNWISNIGTKSNLLSNAFTDCGIGIAIANYTVFVTADLFAES